MALIVFLRLELIVSMKNKISSTFCILPWTHSFVNSDGAYQVCCTSEEYHDGIYDSDNKKLKIQNRPDLDNVMNSRLLKELRLKMLNNEWSELCTRCLDSERLGGISRRMIENNNYQGSIAELAKNTLEDGTINFEFKSLDYRLGNHCNLQCRMCGPFSSEKWLKEWNQVMPIEQNLSMEEINIFKSFDWIKEDYLVDEFREKIDSVERIHFAGGEPLFSPQMTKLLKVCIKLGISKNISISYNTNITRLPEEVLELWKDFKEVKLLCSIDGYGPVNEYIRFPSKWSNIDTNLKFLDQHFKTYNISEIILSCTVQLYNVLTLHELYDYVSTFKKIVPALNLINLKYPDYLSTQVMPKAAKKIAASRLLEVAKEARSKVASEYYYLVDNIEQVIQFMDEKDKSQLLFKLRLVDARVSKNFNLTMRESLPELSLFISEYFLNHIENNAGKYESNK
jgi:MoaA/NifB/PqqE/SkfB family radical SAM enzyme